MSITQLCDFSGAKYLLFGNNVPSIIYYSHLPVLVLALIIGFFVLYKGKQNLAAPILFVITGAFSLWLFLDAIFWASNRPDIIMFVWAFILVIEPIVHTASFYLVYVLLEGKYPPVKWQYITGIIFLPLIILLPTNLALKGFDLSSCLSIEGPLALYYTYFVEILFSLAIVVYTYSKFKKATTKVDKKKILALGIGVIVLLVAFSWGNIIGSFTDNWQFGEYGLFGMPIFLAFLAYSIVQFRLFNIKLIGANVLVVALWVLTGSLFVIQDIKTSQEVIGITFVLSVIFGLILIRSVRNEVKQREHIEILAADLEKANAKLRELDQLKSEFLSFASHQLRSPLTAIHGYTSMLMQGDFGPMSDQVKNSVSTIDQSSTSLITIVNEFLDVSRIEQGRMTYNNADFNVKELAEEVVKELRPNVESKGLQFSFNAEASASYMTYGDQGKIKQVIGNIIDNSIKYTPSGSIAVRVERKNNKILIKVQDTGIGIDADEIPKLFSMFSRAKEAHKTNVSGTGLGLFVAKQMIEAQKGRVWVESPGKGKGSTFFIELLAK